MLNLLYKECRLAIHPTAILFLCLSCMLLIPNYPYYVIFFYTCLAVFFICLSGRENKDIIYMMLLPIRKKDIVSARFLTVILLELIQVLLAVPFALLRNNLIESGNEVGMDANVAFFGFVFIMLGLFHAFFFTKYYKNTDKIGVPFLIGSSVFTLLIILAESSAHVVPFVRDVLDTKDPENLNVKLLVLAAGILCYALLTIFAYRRSVKSFEQQDL